MCFSGAVTSTPSAVKCGDRPDFVLILVVTASELDAYRQHCPDDAVIYVLPVHSEEDYPNGAGVGHTRHFSKKLAEAICPSTFPFAFMLDDSVRFWVGVTLANDPTPQFGVEPETLGQRRTDISLADVLLHFQLQPDVMAQLGVIGFYRANGFCHSNRAYDRTHCTKAVILNLAKLKGVEFEKRVHLWEDLLFHWNAQDIDWQASHTKLVACRESASVSCKCYRFQCSSPQLKGGGCSDQVARNQRECQLCLPAPSNCIASFSLLHCYLQNPCPHCASLHFSRSVAASTGAGTRTRPQRLHEKNRRVRRGRFVGVDSRDVFRQ